MKKDNLVMLAFVRGQSPPKLEVAQLDESSVVLYLQHDTWDLRGHSMPLEAEEAYKIGNATSVGQNCLYGVVGVYDKTDATHMKSMKEMAAILHGSYPIELAPELKYG
jgi:hypothetical protein